MLPRSLYFVGAWARVSATGRFGVRGLGSLGAAPGLGPPPGHAVRPRRVGLRPLFHRSLRAARLVAGGRAPVRLACNAPAAFVGIRVLLIADGSSYGVRHVSPDRFAQRSGPRCGLTSSCSFALAHCESCTAPRRVAVELKASQHDSASISRCSKQTAVHKSSGGLLAEHKLQQHQQGSAARCHAKREREA